MYLVVTNPTNNHLLGVDFHGVLLYFYQSQDIFYHSVKINYIRIFQLCLLIWLGKNNTICISEYASVAAQ